MIPSQSWFPTNLQDRAAWYLNFSNNMTALGTGLGFLAGEITSISSDSDVMQFLGDTDVQVNAYVDGIRTYRRQITEGDIGDPTPGFPADVSFALPTVIPTGLFERLDNYVKRIRAAPSFTPETGALLGINTSGGGPHVPIGDVPPILKASVDPGNAVEVKFTKGDSGGIHIETNVDGGGWTFVKLQLKSPAVFVVPQNTDHTPRGVQIRARFLTTSGDPVGDWSDIVTVQTIP